MQLVKPKLYCVILLYDFNSHRINCADKHAQVLLSSLHILHTLIISPIGDDST